MKLSIASKVEIRRLFQSGIPASKIGPMFGVSTGHARHMCAGIPKFVTFPNGRHKNPIAYYISADSLTSCWIWSGATSGKGINKRGLVFRNGKRIYAYRYIYELMVGEIPDGLFICHKCNNPICVNPDHIYAGTAADNMRDKEERYKRNELTRKKKQPVVSV